MTVTIGAGGKAALMPLEVYTARLPHHGCPGYRGPDHLDVTRGSGGAAASSFAPSRGLLDEAALEAWRED